MRAVGLLYLGLHLAGCAHRVPDPSMETGPLDAVLIPGCPSREDGGLTGCQWRRALWAHHLWEEGVTRRFVTSGNAVYNRYIEAEALKAGMVALGVPEDVVLLETQALHSDENAAYGLAIFEEKGWTRVGVASDAGHAQGIRAFFRGWGHPMLSLPMDVALVNEKMEKGLPDARTEPVPEAEWLPLKQREKEIARRTGRARRPNSLLVYTWAGVRGTFGQVRPRKPPMREPTLSGQRHRIDTAPW